MSNRLDKDKEKALQPKRIEYAVKELVKRGFSCIQDDAKVTFFYKGEKVVLFAYSGWFSGKTVKVGRGIDNLLKQLV